MIISAANRIEASGHYGLYSSPRGRKMQRLPILKGFRNLPEASGLRVGRVITSRIALAALKGVPQCHPKRYEQEGTRFAIHTADALSQQKAIHDRPQRLL